ncbi:glycosyltransferase family 2 protein [uncultured Clostridium sp.]|uniref:glycosyltransferase family 2 protein n=1 Tax=uncultured Clostridium sp. TaxID=59620 RepID=UPI00262CA86A|nr:glycosyltransferase family 2 protein [uncultured Clostridium sp.]
MNLYKISIIIPAYNVINYIKETLESIYNQTFKEFELILVDDGSTDGTYEVLRDYESLHENVKLIKQENSGPSIARNKGLEEAQGEYIVFVDSDDILPKDSLEFRYETVKSAKADIGIFGTYKYDGKNKWPMTNHFLGDGEKTIKRDYNLLLTLGPCNKIFKRELVKNMKFPSGMKYAEDQAFIIEAYLKAKKIYASNYTAYYYRIRPEEAEGSLTKQIVNNSSFVISQVYKSWSITVANIKNSDLSNYEKITLMLKYFERLLKFDVWPPLKNIIVKGSEEEKLNGLKIFEKMIEKTDREVLENSKFLETILTYGFMHENKSLNSSEKGIYIEIVNAAYKDTNKISLKQKAIKMKNKNSIKPLYLTSVFNGLKYNGGKSKAIFGKIYRRVKFKV